MPNDLQVQDKPKRKESKPEEPKPLPLLLPPSIGVFVAIFGLKAILLVQHSYDHKTGAKIPNGKWSLPGGALEAGEDAVAAGKREFKEETGLECAISWGTLIGTFFLRKSAGVVFLFAGDIVSDGAFARSTNETVGADFIPLRDMPGLDIYPAQQAFIRRADKWKPGDPPIYDYPGGDIDPGPAPPPK
jgi:8-oxo-dGTP diphosphatase